MYFIKMYSVFTVNFSRSGKSSVGLTLTLHIRTITTKRNGVGLPCDEEKRQVSLFGFTFAPIVGFQICGRCFWRRFGRLRSLIVWHCGGGFLLGIFTFGVCRGRRCRALKIQFLIV